MSGEWHGGKGSKERATNYKAYTANYDKIFNKHNMQTRIQITIKAENKDILFDKQQDILDTLTSLPHDIDIEVFPNEPEDE